MKAARPAATALALALGLLAAPLAAQTQQLGKVYRIGSLSRAPREPAAPYIKAFEEGLRELGYAQDRNVTFEHRYADLRPERLPDLAAELVRLKVDVIVATSTPAALAAKQATTTIPIVMGPAWNPVREGLIASLSWPGGNITGLTSDVTPETYGKVLQLLKELLPKVSRVAVLAIPDPSNTPYWKATEDAARALGVTLQSVEVRGSTDLESAFAAIMRERPGALFVWADALTLAHRARIVDFAAKNRLPVVSDAREFADVGGLMAYGTDLRDLFRRAASYVDKILKGAKPADLPVEQPTKYQLVLNRKTANVLGLAISPAVFALADEVIE